MVRKKSSVGVPPKAMSLREFGHRLDEMLLDRGWSQADLHRKAGLSKDTISKWVAGKVDPSPRNLGVVAKAFGMSIDELYPHYMDNLDNAAQRSRGGVEFVSNDSKMGTLTVDRVVSTETAMKILDLLKNDAVD